LPIAPDPIVSLPLGVTEPVEPLLLFWSCDIELLEPVVPELDVEPEPAVCADATPRQSNSAAVIPNAFILISSN
jgi:hypothetical protein